MKTYAISFRYSRDGRSWNRTSTSIKASSESSAISQLKSRYPYVDDIRVMYVR